MHPEWCDPDELLFLHYVCEQVLGYPIWCTMFVLDCVAVWLIFSILRRARQQQLERRRAKSQMLSAVKVRQAWGLLYAMMRQASVASVSASRGKACSDAERWRRGWDCVAKVRGDRRSYLWRKEFDLGAVFTRAAGPVLILAMCCLISFEIHGFFFLALPWYQLGEHATLAAKVLAAPTAFRIFLDYARTSLTSPGSPAANDVAELDPQGPDLELIECGKSRREPKRCEPCGTPKPARTHHCKTCRRCVLKMDHHCPFVHNCIGLRNHRYFILFLADLVVGCSILALTLLPQVPSVAWGTRIGTAELLTFPHRLHVSAVFLVAAIFAGLLGGFLYFHLQLVSVNETTLEFMKRRAGKIQKGEEEGAYSRGPLENYISVCGQPPYFLRRSIEVCLDWITPRRVAKRSA